MKRLCNLCGQDAGNYPMVLVEVYLEPVWDLKHLSLRCCRGCAKERGLLPEKPIPPGEEHAA